VAVDERGRKGLRMDVPPFLGELDTVVSLSSSKSLFAYFDVSFVRRL
jgi:hypothetical protein